MYASFARRLTLATLLAALPPAALACGEGMFNTGRGLPYQSYLAPRPAAILVYDDPAGGASGRSAKVLAGLKKAGHSITVVRDRQALSSAVRGQRYDVVIAALDRIEDVAELDGDGAPALLPVVSRAVRNSPSVKNRFNLFLVDGASLGQYLRAINALVARG